jgi:hypothetical protein
MEMRREREVRVDIISILATQLADPFRIGLLVALLFTARNRSAALHRWLPIALGLVFVAVLIPTAMASGLEDEVGAQIGVGIVSNAIILGLMLFAETAFERFRRKD